MGTQWVPGSGKARPIRKTRKGQDRPKRNCKEIREKWKCERAEPTEISPDMTQLEQRIREGRGRSTEACIHVQVGAICMQTRMRLAGVQNGLEGM